jgi:hypothetical protein
MWLITDKGFLSVVSYDPTKDRHNKRSNRQLKSFGPRPVLVRARREEHLDQLKPYWSKLRIEKDEYADYTYRAVMPRTRWVEFLADAGDKIDYDSHFKEVVRDRCPGSKAAVKDFYSAMMSIWSKLAAIQPFAPYGGFAWSGAGKYTEHTGTGGGYGSLYTGTKAPAQIGTGFSNYGGNTFRTGEHAPSNNGYTAGGVKSAADSAAVFTGYGFGGRLSSDPAPGDLAKQAEEPESVTDLAVMLMLKDPDEIFVSSSAPSAIGLLFDEAVAQYGGRMSAYEVANLLNELMNEPECPQEDIDALYEAYDHILLNYEMPEVEDDADMEIDKPTASIDLTGSLGGDDEPYSIAREAVSLFLGD